MTTLTINQVNSTPGDTPLGPESSPHIRFATLQLALSAAAKDSAMDYIEELEKSQEEQKKVSGFWQAARTLQQTAKNDTVYKISVMPDDMHKYFTDNKLAMGSTDDKGNSSDEWEINITSLKAVLDKLGTDTQQKMVFVQDFMGQYNSNLQGANSAIQAHNQTLGELAHTR